MDKLTDCGSGRWCIYAMEILGVILIIIGVLLTIATGSGLGILAIIFVGGCLCCHKCMYKKCHTWGTTCNCCGKEVCNCPVCGCAEKHVCHTVEKKSHKAK